MKEREEAKTAGNRVVYVGGVGEIEEKKSRFIATVRPVHTEEEAQAFLEEMRKKYWDARHNCHAYVIGERNELTRSSDDGEPAGTAGHPMLEVLQNENLHDVAVVVTRYFGGTLLGTGGLVRAYTAAVQAGLAACTIVEQQNGVVYRLNCDYTDVGKVQYLLSEREIPTLASTFAEKVELQVALPAEEETRFLTEIAEKTAGRAGAEKLRTCRYAIVNGEIVLA